MCIFFLFIIKYTRGVKMNKLPNVFASPINKKLNNYQDLYRSDRAVKSYNPKDIDIQEINFGFDKKYLEIVAIYDRPITTLDNRKKSNQYKLYGWKKYELTPIFLREFKYYYE